LHEFTIGIQTPRGTTTDEAAAARVAAAIDSAEEIAGVETIPVSRAGRRHCVRGVDI
jgi:hypothetical protein